MGFPANKWDRKFWISSAEGAWGEGEAETMINRVGLF
jgi:hypothetical protein